MSPNFALVITLVSLICVRIIVTICSRRNLSRQALAEEVQQPENKVGGYQEPRTAMYLRMTHAIQKCWISALN